MIEEIRTKLIALLQAAKEDTTEGINPKQVKGYGGELRSPERLKMLPSVFVDVPQRFEIEAQGSNGSLYDGDFDPEIILFVRNKKSGEATVQDLAQLTDWVITALKDQTIMVAGAPVQMASRIQGRLITDMDPASAVLTLNLETL